MIELSCDNWSLPLPMAKNVLLLRNALELIAPSTTKNKEFAKCALTSVRGHQLSISSVVDKNISEDICAKKIVCIFIVPYAGDACFAACGPNFSCEVDR